MNGIGMQGRAGKKRFILGAVEPVSDQGMADGRHMKAELVGAACLGHQAQEGEAVLALQNFVIRVGRGALGIDAALQEGIGLATDGQVDGACGRGGGTQADAPVLPIKIAGVEQSHAAGMNIPGFGHHHDPGGASVQAVHPVVLIAGTDAAGGHAEGRAGGLIPGH